MFGMVVYGMVKVIAERYPNSFTYTESSWQNRHEHEIEINLDKIESLHRMLFYLYFLGHSFVAIGPGILSMPIPDTSKTS